MPSPSVSIACKSVAVGLSVPLGLERFRTTTLYLPVELLAAIPEMMLVVKKLTVSLEVLETMGTEPLRHSYPNGGGYPIIETLKVTAAPAGPLWLAGAMTNTGSTNTTSAAGRLSVGPTESVTETV